MLYGTAKTYQGIQLRSQCNNIALYWKCYKTVINIIISDMTFYILHINGKKHHKMRMVEVSYKLEKKLKKTATSINRT